MKTVGYCDESGRVPSGGFNRTARFARRSDSAFSHPGSRYLLVRVKAVSVNPVDTKVRAVPQSPDGKARVLGFGAAGIVGSIGSAVTLFKPGDEVFYAGDINRQGTIAEFHAVDERIVGRKPRSLDWAAAAALPLTSITAWEALFDRLDIHRPVLGANAILIIGSGASGGRRPSHP